MIIIGNENDHNKFVSATLPDEASEMKRLLQTFLLCWLFIGYSFLCTASSKVTPVRILDLESTNDPIAKYATEVLRLALKKSGQNFQLQKQNATRIPQVRLIEELGNAKAEIDVLWTMTSLEREQQLLPIRIPIDKGLMGWRISFIRVGDQSRFEHVDSLKTLEKFNAGQGYFWPDTTILQSNGLPVVTGTASALASMLEQARFDYFPRSVIEIWNEQKSLASTKLEIENSFVLPYPAAMYFFVAPRNQTLAKAIETGLERSIRDGSFNALFSLYCRDFITKAKLGHRRVLELKNPLLPSSNSAEQRPELWLSNAEIQALSR